MIGLQYIADTFHMEYKTVAEKIGVSKQTFQDWIKERRKIPQQRLLALSNLFEIEEIDWFQKELTDFEKSKIQIHYFEQSDAIEEIEDVYIDNEGKEQKVKYSISQNKDIINFLHERSVEDRLIERVVAVVRNDATNGNDNKGMIEQCLQVIEANELESKTLELVLYALTQKGQDDWGGVHPRFIKYEENGFFDKFNDLLKGFGLSKN